MTQCWESVKHQLVSDEGENRKQIVMSSLWKKNTLYYVFTDKKSFEHFGASSKQNFELFPLDDLKVCQVWAMDKSCQWMKFRVNTFQATYHIRYFDPRSLVHFFWYLYRWKSIFYVKNHLIPFAFFLLFQNTYQFWRKCFLLKYF